MNALRPFLSRHRRLAWLVLACAIAARVLVPAGFMPTFSPAGVALVICSGSGPMTMAAGSHHGGGGEAPAKVDAPCAFAGLAAPALGGADPVQLALLLVAIVAAGLLAVSPPPGGRAPFLRPLVRGPPADRLNGAARIAI